MSDRHMKILHLTAGKRLSHGQRAQLQHEERASEALRDVQWDTIALHGEEPQCGFERRMPSLFRPIFLRNLYAWIFLMRRCRNYDFVLQRHMTFDPFVMALGWLIPNRVTVHHSKEVDELKLIRSDWRGQAASMLQRCSGLFNSWQVRGVLGVTQEIADYQTQLYRSIKHAGVYANGIQMDSLELLEDGRNDEVHIAFVCGTFSRWHGVDLLIRTFDEQKSTLCKERTTIHLIGRLSKAQISALQAANAQLPVFAIHGHLPREEYKSILSKCDIGLDALAIDRKGLTQAATLKVREYLASGLPVYSAHEDTAVPNTHPYYECGPVDASRIIAYARKMKDVSRRQVREESKQFIDKTEAMRRVHAWLLTELTS